MSFVVHNPYETCALCGRTLPISAVVSKTMVDAAGRPVTRHYCADALACIAACNAKAIVS